MTDYSQIPDCFYRISIKALILDEDERFLLCREDNGKWDFPGGGLSHDENPRTALSRELQEEMGVSFETMKIRPSYFITAKNRHGIDIANILYETTLNSFDIVQSKECQEISFFTPEEALKLDLFPNVIKFCEQHCCGFFLGDD